MSMKLPVGIILADLEAQMKMHQERETFHSAQESLHHEQRLHHAAQYQKISGQFEAFKASVEAVVDLVRPQAPLQAENDEDPLRVRMSRLIGRVIAEQPAGQRFGARQISDEVNERFQKRLRREVDIRTVSATLRRLERNGSLKLIRKGRPHLEALYTRE